MRVLAILLLAVSAACHTATTSDVPVTAAAPQLVTAKALLDVATVRPGQAFTVGVELEMQPGWHVYWKNPGDAGLPVSIRISGDGGFSAGQIGWPVPVRFMQPGDIVGYGYTDAVFLTVPVTAPVGVAPGEKHTIHVDVSWLVCKDVCLPGKASFDVPVTIGTQSTPANAALFDRWRELVPSSGPTPFEITRQTGALDAEGRRGEFQFTLAWPGGVRDVEWFPSEDPALAFEGVSVRMTGDRTAELTFTVSVLAGQRPASDNFESVIAFTTSDGRRRGAVLPVRLAARRSA